MYSGKSDTNSQVMKAFYPPNYDVQNGHLKVPRRIQRFNEDYETVS